VHPVWAAAAELVELHRDQCGFRPAAQPRDHPRVRVGFLVVVHRTVREVLAHLVPGAVVPQVV
jgi:hypothetical protein